MLIGEELLVVWPSSKNLERTERQASSILALFDEGFLDMGSSGADLDN